MNKNIIHYEQKAQHSRATALKNSFIFSRGFSTVISKFQFEYAFISPLAAPNTNFSLLTR